MIFPNPLIIGSRSSALAILQAELVKKEIIKTFPDQYTEKNILIKTFKTTGDKILDQKLIDFGGKGLFTKELEIALFNHEIHCAVHSTKDMATTLPDGLKIVAYLPRENPADAMISKGNLTLKELPKGAIIGTASLRRTAQILLQRPDLTIKLVRGNVDTRLEKLNRGEYDALIIAYAALIRKDMADRVSEVFDIEHFLPAVGQGVICIETLSDAKTNPIFETLNDHQEAFLVELERCFMKKMDGSCRTPIAAYAKYIETDKVRFRGEVYKEDGSEKFIIDEIILIKKAIEKVKKLSENLKDRIPTDIFLYE